MSFSKNNFCWFCKHFAVNPKEVLGELEPRHLKCSSELDGFILSLYKLLTLYAYDFNFFSRKFFFYDNKLYILYFLTHL